MSERICTECGGKIIQTCHGELTCSRCGLVYESLSMPSIRTSKLFLETSLEPPIQVIFSPLGSYIGRKGESLLKDSQGRVLPLKTQMLFKRLRALQDIDPYTRQTALRHKALRILNKVVNLLNIDQRIRDQAIDKYKTFTKKEGFSRNNILIIAACLLIASREVKGVKPLTLNEICEGFKLVGHDIHPRVLSKTVFKVLNVIGAKPTIMSPEDYVDKVIDKLCSSKEIVNRIQVNRLTVHEYFSELREEAKKLLCSLNERRKMGKNPYALAVSSIYAASLITSSKRELQISILTQKLLSEIADVAEYTIREHYYTLFKDEVEKLISATSPM